MAYKKWSTTRATALSSALSSSATAVFLTDGSTYPDPAVGGNGPYTVLIGYGSDREEIVTVTAKPSTNALTVTRGEDGSTATAKNIGDVVVHGVSKRDWDDLLPKAGGTLTGALTLSGAPTVDLHAATKVYVDERLLKSGGTLTGALTLSGAPTVDLHAATKKYVDDGGVWTSYTPTLTGFTPGNGTLTGKYARVNKLVHFRAQFTFGSTSAAASTTPKLSLPVTAASTFDTPLVGILTDTNSGYYAAVGHLDTTTTVALWWIGGSGLMSVSSASLPFAWAAGDLIAVSGTYEAA